jgi:tetratricopeptide (TPR) repeat protein
LSTTSKSCRSLVLLIALVTARAALAQQGGNPDREVTARALFAEGRYREALELYVKLYADTAHPTYMRNIGRCYQNLGEPDKAIASFREYLRQASDLSADQRATIDAYIREMEEVKRSRAAPNAAPPAARPLPPDAPPAVATETGAATVPDGGGLRRGVAGGVAAIGLVGLGVGTWFGLDARSQWNSATAMCPQPEVTGCGDAARRLGRDADSAALGATILIPAGAVAVAAGVILWLTSPERPKQRASARLRIVPPLPQGGGGMLAGGVAGTF